jgi:palmitoyltransferase
VVDDPSELAPVNNMIHGLLNGNAAGSPTPNAGGTKRTKTGKLWSEIERPVPQVDSGVRWCRFCEINKPDRTHHCRHCGTCVMQFDRKMPQLDED